MQTKTFTGLECQSQTLRDAYAMLTTNIQLGPEQHGTKTIVIVGCLPGVGSTTLATGLALTMAECGMKVLLVDADMRKPADETEAPGGLSDYLKGRVRFEDVLCKTNIENLTYLSSGRHAHNPMGLLCLDRFEFLLQKVREEFQFVIFDTPSLSSVSDASYIAAKCDAALLLAGMGETDLVTLRQCKEKLEQVKANILGVIVNKVGKSQYKKYFASYNYFSNEKKYARKKKAKGGVAVLS